jgi:hypothetical protein
MNGSERLALYLGSRDSAERTEVEGVENHAPREECTEKNAFKGQKVLQEARERSVSWEEAGEEECEGERGEDGLGIRQTHG